MSALRSLDRRNSETDVVTTGVVYSVSLVKWDITRKALNELTVGSVFLAGNQSCSE